MQTRHLHPTDLEYFVKICQLGSMTQASVQLGVTQPALSKSIRRLEQTVGAKLLERSTRGARPTQIGLELMHRGSVILSDLKTTQHLLQEMSGSRMGTVSMGTAPSLSHHFLPSVIQLAQQKRPRLFFQVNEGIFHQLLPRLLLGELDFIISSPSSNEPLAPELVCEPLGSNYFMACVAHNHPLALSNAIADEQLLDYPWVLTSPQGILRNTLNFLFKSRALPAVTPQVETSCTTLSKALITQQNFISFLPVESFAEEQKMGLIRPLNIPWLYWKRDLYLLLRRGHNPSPAAQFVIDLIKAEAPQRLTSPPPTFVHSDR